MGFVGFIVGALIQIGLNQYQKSRRKKALKRNFKGVDVRQSPSANEVLVLYGRTAVDGTIAYLTVNNNFAGSSGGGRRNFGSVPRKRKGKRNEFLLMQQVICVGEIDTILDVWADGKRVSGGNLSGYVQVEIGNYGQASAMASAFTGQRTDTDKFTGLNYASIIAYQYYKKPKFSGVPAMFYFVRGRKLKTINESSGTYSLSSAETYSANAVRVLLDYLTSDVYGPGLSVDDIDLQSWYTAQQKAGEIIQGTGNVLWNKTYPTGRNQAYGTNYSTWSDYYGGIGFSSQGVTGIVNTAAANPTTEPVTGLLRYEYNGQVSTTRDYPSMIDQILEVMPGAQFFRGGNGKYKLVVPDSETDEADQSVGLVNEDLLLGHVEVLYPDNTTKLNRLVVSYSNMNKDFATDTVTFPEPAGALQTRFATEDGGVVLNSTDDINGSNNPYHAKDIAGSLVLLSRRPRYNFKMRAVGYLYEPGDIIRVIDPICGVNTYMMIESIQVDAQLVVHVTGIQFDKDDYTWIGDEAQVIEGLDYPDFTVLAPQSVTLAVDGDNRMSTTTWEPNENETGDVIQYALEFFDGTEWIPLVVVPLETTKYVYTIAFGAITGYKIRVAAISITGETSDWTESNAIDVENLEGLDGEEGIGIEYIFTSSTDGAEITNTADLPVGTWVYDFSDLASGVTRGDYNYYDGTPADLDEDRPYLIRFNRGVPGQPAQGEDIGNRGWNQIRSILI